LLQQDQHSFPRDHDLLNQILKFRKLSLAFAGVTHQDGALPRGRGGRGGRGRGLVLNHGRLRLKLQLLVEIYMSKNEWMIIYTKIQGRNL